MPPARIGDLKLKVIARRQSVIATWTAPGDDFDAGTVAGYRFLTSTNISDLLDPMEDVRRTVLDEIRRPDLAGTQTSHQFAFDKLNKDHFVGIVAFDEEGNTGKMSNIVAIRLEAEEVLAAGGKLGDGPGMRPGGNPINEPVKAVASEDQASDDEGVMIGVLCGVFVVIGLILWVGIWYMRNHGPNATSLMKSSTKNDGVTAKFVNGTPADLHDTSVGSSEFEVSISDKGHGNPSLRKPMIPQLSSLASGGHVGSYPSPPPKLDLDSPTKDDGTPTYWSASKLLGEHEQRAANYQELVSTTTFHNNVPRALDPIVEDPELDYVAREDVYKTAGGASGITMTSTPNAKKGSMQDPKTKYVNLTFPRRGTSMPPLRELDLDLNRGQEQQVYEGGIYGYARSEPPSGPYGTLGRKSTGKVPPKIPPKPSLSALMGLGPHSDAEALVDDVFVSVPKRGASVLDSLTNGLTVRNISHV